MPEQKPIPVSVVGDAAKTNRLFRQFFPNTPPEQVARAAGVVDGMRAEITADGDSLKVVGRHSDGESRVATYYHPVEGPEGQQHIHQEISWNFFGDQHRGQGYQRFADQLKALDKLPQVKKITVPDAAGVAGSTMFNGYYTWPRYGFNAPLSPDNWMQLHSKFWHQLPPDADFHKLFDHPEGAEEWKARGNAVTDMEFDLAPDSEHRKRFKAYYADRKQKDSAADGGSVRPAVEGVPPVASGQEAHPYRTQGRIAEIAEALRLRYRLKYKQADQRSGVLLPVEGPVRDQILSLANQIPDHLLTGNGRETDPHLTLLYGLHSPDPEPVRRLFSGAEGKIGFRLGKISVFKNPDFDVVKLEVHSPDAHRANALLKTLPHTSNFPNYNPHITLAYVKSGEGDRIAEQLGSVEGSGEAGKVIFSDPNRNHTHLPIGEQKQQYKTERLRGGKADGKKDSQFDPKDLRKGMRVEREHTSDPKVAAEIAKDHLTESGDYYDKLDLIEKRPLSRLRKLLAKGKKVTKYTTEKQPEAHPSVRGFQLEHALRRAISDPETTSELKTLSHTLLTQGVDRSDVAYGIHDEVEQLPEDHWLRKAGYTWPAITHKLHLDAAVGHLIGSLVGEPMGGMFNYDVSDQHAPSIVRSSIGELPDSFIEGTAHRKAAEGLQILKEQGHTDQDLMQSVLRHERRMYRGVDRSSGRSTLEEQQADATSPKTLAHASDRYKAVKYQTKPVYIKGPSGRHRFDNLHTVAAERAPNHPVYSGEEAKQLHQSPELAPDLTPEEAKAVEVFKSSSAVNRFNRDKGDFGHRPDLQKVSDTLDELLERHPKTNRPLSLFRIVSHPGFADQFEGANEVGTVYSDKAHFSTGLDADYSVDALGGDFADNVLFQIRVPAGSKAIAIGTKGGHLDKEREVLLPRNARFRVVSVEPMGKGKYVVLDHLPEGAEESKPEQYAAKGKNPEGGLTVAEARRQGISEKVIRYSQKTGTPLSELLCV